MFGTNWTATYYNNTDLSGTPIYAEALPNGININWGVGSPSPLVHTDNFSARFTSVQLFDAATYEFIVSSDAGVRIYINDTLVLDQFIVRTLTTDRFRLGISPGSYSLRVEYFASVGQAAIQVQWYAAGRFEEAPKVTEQPTFEISDTSSHETSDKESFVTTRVYHLEEMFAMILGEEAPYYYRGQADSKWGLIPSIFREIKMPVSEENVEKILQLEREIYKDFADQSRTYLPAWVARSNPWEMLCIAQHFGVPTRLLDWTSNFLAATYFAVCEKPGVDGVVWRLNGDHFTKHPYEENKPRYTIFDYLPPNTSFFSNSLAKQEYENSNFTLMRPPHIDSRIKNQDGIFSVHISFSDPKTLSDFVYDHENYLTNRLIPFNGTLFKFEIAAEAKKEIKSKLEKMGVNFSHLFPDMNGLGKYFEDQRKQKFDAFHNQSQDS